jgi:hypothetical protein
LPGNGVVANIRAAVATGQVNGLACACILVAKTSRGAHRDGVTTQKAGIGCSGRTDRCTGVAIVGFTSGGDAADRQCLGGDGCCGRTLPGNSVVAHIRTAVTALQGHRFAASCVLVAKGTGGRYRYRIAADKAGISCTGCTDGCTGGAVVGFTCGGNAADCQGLGGDGDGIARTGCAQAGQCVVGSQPATGCGGTGFIAQGDGLDVVAGACVFAVGCGSAIGECFTAYARGDRDGASPQCGASIVGFCGA